MITPTGEPAAIGQPATSVSLTETRLTIVTDVSQRNVSSMTSGMSDAIGVDPREVVGVREQRVEAVAHDAERRLRAGREQQAQEAVDLASR